MKIINRSELPIDEVLWRRIAALLCVEEYRKECWRGKAAELNVVVDRQKQRNGDKNALYGLHTPKKIMIYPCRECTAGTVQITFLHEIMHEWIFWRHPKLKERDWLEDFCEGTARHVFRLLGGRISAEQNCRRYRIEFPARAVETEITPLLAEMANWSPDQLRAFGREQMT